MNTTTKNPTKWISVSTALDLMKKRTGIRLSPERLRQILNDNRNMPDGIRARRLGGNGWWNIDQASFEEWLDREYGQAAGGDG